MSYESEQIRDGGERQEYKKGEYPESITCNVCDKTFTYDRRQRTTKHTCRICIINRHRWALKAKMVAYKGGCCQVCGYSGSLRSLDFHHIDPAMKDFDFGGKHCLGAAKLVAELTKCVCLCRNCHGEVHEAIEALTWGHPPATVLAEVEAAHRNWTPTTTKPDFSRNDWRTYHPKFSDPAARTEKNNNRSEQPQQTEPLPWIA